MDHGEGEKRDIYYECETNRYYVPLLPISQFTGACLHTQISLAIHVEIIKCNGQ